ncbi:unnamed protein product [Dibothriocephalus latus]|uniref:Calpain catalytic domain-containing protein n=1 Tax=Dibothriocephalus latus TaxID=60516 RepID=A0A3P7LXZ6_DIBLA|nr:unnamed protein product [Dibothriocephalus latus]
MQLMMSIAQKKYDNIVKRLKGTNKLYEDPDFPPNQTSLGNIPNLRGPVYWKRPKEINPKAEFIVGGFDRSDVNQGMLGAHIVNPPDRRIVTMISGVPTPEIGYD